MGDSVDELTGMLSEMDLSKQPKYVKQPATMTMAKCEPRPPYRWTKASKALGIPKGFCEKDVNWKPEPVLDIEYDEDEEEQKSFAPPSLEGASQSHDLSKKPSLSDDQKDLIRKTILGPQVYDLCKNKKATDAHLEERAFWLSSKLNSVCTVDDIVNLCGLRDATKECEDSITDPALKKFNELLESQTECPICFDELGTTFTAAGACGHLFHVDCLKQVQRLGSRSRCPSCRGPLEPFTIETKYEYWEGTRKIKSIETYRGGKPHGVWKIYLNNGNLDEELTYKNGELQLYKQHYSDGKLKKIEPFKNGKLNGVVQEFWTDGKVRTKSTFVDNEVIGMSVNYNKEGKVESEGEYKKGMLHGLYKEFYPKGTLSHEGMFKFGEPVGSHTTYYDSKKVHEKLNYNDYGLKHGEQQELWDNGKVKMIREFVNGKQEGDHKEFDKNGEIKTLFTKSNTCPEEIKVFEARYKVKGMEAAIKGKSLECVMYLVAKGERPTPSNCITAADNGSLTMLRYLLDKGGVCDKGVTVKAAELGDLKMVRFAHERGCGWSTRVCSGAAKIGSLACLQYAHEHGCPWNEDTTINAAKTLQLDCLRYAVEKGCELNYKALRAAKDNFWSPKTEQVVAYIESKGIQY